MKSIKFLQFDKLNLYYDYIIGILILFVVLNLAASNAILVLLGLIFFIDFKRSIALIQDKISNKAFFILLFFIAYSYLQALFFDGWTGKRYVFFILIPSVILLCFRVSKHVRVLLSFVLSVLLVSIAGLSKILAWYFESGDFNMTSGGMIDDLLILQRPYLGFCLVVGSILCMYLSTIYKRYQLWFFGMALFMIFYIYLISARISYISLLVVMALYLIFYFKAKVIYKGMLFISISLFVTVGFYLNPDLSQRFKFVDNIFNYSEGLKNSEPRILIWGCALQIIKTDGFNPVVGLKSVDALEQKLVDCYALDQGNEHRKAYFLKSRFNTHNQFMDIYITLGAIGLVLFCSVVLVLLIQNRRNFYWTAILITLVLFCLVENVLYVQRGVYLFAIVLSFLFFGPRKIAVSQSKLH